MTVNSISRSGPFALAAVLALSAVPLWVGGCGDDEGDRVFTVNLTCNPDDLFGDGSNFAVCSVTVLDQRREPAEPGTRMVFVGRDLADPSRETGAFGPSRNAQDVKFLDQVGSATTEFRCTEVVTAAVIAQTDAGDRGIAQIDCQDIAGDWRITQVVPEPAGVLPGESSEVCAWAETAEAVPPPNGTQIRFTTTAVNGGFGSTGEPDARDGTDGQGKACVNYVAQAGNYTEDVTVVANFDNTNFGNTPLSTTVIVDADLPENEVRLSAPTETLLADGVSQTTITATVFGAGASPLEGEEVILRITDESVGSGSLSDSGRSTTNANGMATFTFTAGTERGEVIISGTAPGVGPDTEDTLRLVLLDVGEIVSLGPEITPLGIQGTGRNPSTDICFQVNDHRGTPFSAGLPVTFDTTGSTSAGAMVTPESEDTDAEGKACTTLSSGTTFGFAVVRACARVGTAEVCGSSENIPVVGVTPSRSGMSLTCSVRNIGALRYQQGAVIREPDTGSLCTSCELRLRDRDNNLVGFERQVTFAAESGRFSPSARTTNDLEGKATVVWCADGNVPTDVLPFPGGVEPSWIEAESGVIRNPRDGLVTIIAYVNGEEYFDDVNQNGTWDSGELFLEQPEPFIDADDDNSYCGVVRPGCPSAIENERHIDIAGGGRVDGEFDAANGQWDGGADTVIWVQTRVLLTGSPYFDLEGEFSGVASGAPTSLPLDSDYNAGVPPRLSHWYIKDTAETVYGNWYAPEVVGAGCNQESAHCFIVPTPWTPDPALEVWFVARDQFGNPINGSIAGISHDFLPDGCSTSINVETGEYLSPGNELPFTFEEITGGLRMDYEIAISDFVSGAWQRFILTPGSNPIQAGGCQFRMLMPLTACTGCGDPADDELWYFMINDAPPI